jgi:hypothetical protein
MEWLERFRAAQAFSMLSWVALAFAAALLIAAALRRRPSLAVLLLGFGFYAVATAVASRGFGLWTKPDWFESYGLTFLWDGKLAAIAMMLVLIALMPNMTFARAGLTLRQADGSVIPALLMGAALCAFAWSFAIFYWPGTNENTAEALIFQATMPGLDEELRFRGPTLVLLSAALGTRFRLFGGEIGWGVPVTALLFGLAHGMRFTEGGWQFDAFNTLYTGALGFGLAWMRERTGSLALPVVWHNIINVGVSLL